MLFVRALQLFWGEEKRWWVEGGEEGVSIGTELK